MPKRKTKRQRFQYPLEYKRGLVNNIWKILKIETEEEKDTLVRQFIYFDLDGVIYVGLAEYVWPRWRIVYAKPSVNQNRESYSTDCIGKPLRDNHLINPRVGRTKIKMKQKQIDIATSPKRKDFEGEQTLEEMGTALGQIDSALENSEGNIRLFDETTGKWLDYVINPEVPGGTLGTGRDYRK